MREGWCEGRVGASRRVIVRERLLNLPWLRVHGTCTRTRTHTHTHTLVLVLVLVFTTVRTGYVVPIQGVSQMEVTRLVVPLAVGTPALSPQLHGPLSAVGYSSMGL